MGDPFTGNPVIFYYSQLLQISTLSPIVIYFIGWVYTVICLYYLGQFYFSCILSHLNCFTESLDMQ